jgi:hypothetical protein
LERASNFFLFSFLLFDYDLFAARRRRLSGARRGRGLSRALAGVGAAPQQPDPSAGGDFGGVLAVDAAGEFELAQAALDVPRGLADLLGDGLVAGPAVVLVPGPVLDQGDGDGLSRGTDGRIGEQGIKARVVWQRSTIPARPRRSGR